MTTTIIAGHVVRQRPHIGVSGSLYDILDGDVLVKTMASYPSASDVRDAVRAHRAKVVPVRASEVEIRDTRPAAERSSSARGQERAREATIRRHEKMKRARNAEIASDIATSKRGAKRTKETA